ncbi:MAG: DUF2752 domain-containing protein [Bacillota bacterium]
MKKRPNTKALLLWPFILHLKPGPAGPEQIFLASVVGGALVLPFFLAPSATGLGTHTRLLVAPCLFYRVSGLPCPLCGMTTSLSLLARGRLLASLTAHPLGWLAFLYLCALAGFLVWAAVTRRVARLELRATPVQVFAAIFFAWTLRLVVWVFTGSPWR